MKPEVITEFKRLVHPMQPEDPDASYNWHAWFVGTVDEAAQAELLRERGVPGEDGRPKSYTLSLGDRKVRVQRYTKRLVRVCFWATKAEERDHLDDSRRLIEEREALKKAAELDAQAALLAERAALQPKTAEEFQQAAEDALWRAYCGFCLAFVDKIHPSGFYFDQLVKDEIRGHIHSAIWAIRDTTALHDAAHLRKPIDELRSKASKLDAPLQRFLASVKDVPIELQEPRDE